MTYGIISRFKNCECWVHGAYGVMLFPTFESAYAKAIQLNSIAQTTHAYIVREYHA